MPYQVEQHYIAYKAQKIIHYTKTHCYNVEQSQIVRRCVPVPSRDIAHGTAYFDLKGGGSDKGDVYIYMLYGY
ncbi:unnamed protein product [Brugia pahangi]|uniref:Astacin domain-containing protein n=1 Tax=Brugia pahangi TaxID=6280 RepID=A0A0N4T142_BRUPA|nr:unnamed protein product [Brugia pahangi]